MFRFPGSTPALPNMLPQYPLLTPEQLQYLQLLNMNQGLGQGLQGLGNLGHLAQLGQLGPQQPSFTTVINSKIITTSVTVTESEEYR